MGRCSLLTFLTDRDNPNDRDVAYLRAELSCTKGYEEAVNDLRQSNIKLFVRAHGTVPERQVHFEDIALGNAITTPALGGFMSISVQQFMFCRHRIRLNFPYLQVIATKVSSGQIEYFPQEMLDIEYVK